MTSSLARGRAGAPRGLSASRALAMGLCAIAAAMGCDSCCTEDLNPIGGEPICEVKECRDGDAFRFGACVAGGCLADSDCCPGTRCRTDINTCFPILLDPDFECETSADCADPAQRCIPTAIGNRDPLPVCVYETCSGDSECGFGRACFDGHCVQHAPCGGSCPDGTVCDVNTSRCVSLPQKLDRDGNPTGEVDASIAKNCLKACDGIRVVTDPLAMSGEVCCALECECKSRPPIVPTRFGRYSRVALGEGEVLVSAYDGEFGDLVLAHFGRDGAFQRLDYVDGVPTDAPFTADPSGPRGGISEPGVNVGTHTSIVTNAQGKARIAYHDEDGRSLKVAIQQDDNSFRSYFLDGGDVDANVGQFTDIALGSDGTLFVSYLAHNAVLNGLPGRSTGLKLAKSRNANPASASDWDITVVDARGMFDPCNNSCAAGTQCVLNGGAPQCLPDAAGCAMCSSSNHCVNTGTAAECLPPPLPPESADVPRARGLFTSIALEDGQPIIAYYDGIEGDLRAARVPATGAPTLFVVDGDGQNGHKKGDVGRFPTVAPLNGQLTIVYEDFARHEVRAWQGTNPGQDGVYSVVDLGKDPARSGKLFVGGGARLAQGAGKPVVVYQDASNLDLKIAAQNGTAWSTSAVLRDGAHGFYSDIVVDGNTAFVVSVLAELDQRGTERSRLGLTVQSLP